MFLCGKTAKQAKDENRMHFSKPMPRAGDSGCWQPLSKRMLRHGVWGWLHASSLTWIWCCFSSCKKGKDKCLVLDLLNAAILFVLRLHNVGFVKSQAWKQDTFLMETLHAWLYNSKEINDGDFVPPAAISSTKLEECCFHLEILQILVLQKDKY
jgi:hypothetical protein